jgi:hypothetical protein
MSLGGFTMGSTPTEYQKQLLLNIANYQKRITVLKQQQALTSAGISEDLIRTEVKIAEQRMVALRESQALNEELEKIYSRRLKLLRMMLAKEIPYADVSILLQIEEAEAGIEQLQKLLAS